MQGLYTFQHSCMPTMSVDHVGFSIPLFFLCVCLCVYVRLWLEIINIHTSLDAHYTFVVFEKYIFLCRSLFFLCQLCTLVQLWFRVCSSLLTRFLPITIFQYILYNLQAFTIVLAHLLCMKPGHNVVYVRTQATIVIFSVSLFLSFLILF